jgi:hypothetical protein
MAEKKALPETQKILPFLAFASIRLGILKHAI